MIRRTTPTKEAVMAVLTATPKALSQDAIVQKIEIGIDRATIYRVLNQFCEDGMVHRIVADDGKQYFAVCRKCDQQQLPDNHFHFRCTSCQTIECLPAVVNFSLPLNYSVEKVNCVLIGVCKDCA
ncbi:MAG: transcriptional repressor [Flavobacterium sp.]|nr:MAG: transcriptional repressor [Flavobacterium sp.]